MSILLQRTWIHAPEPDIFAHDDDTVTRVADGSLISAAKVAHNPDGSISVSLKGNTIEEIQPHPLVATVRIKRIPGWQGKLGWEADLLEWGDAHVSPGVYALAVYEQGDATVYRYTTGGFIWNEDKQLWGAVCPPGFEPGDDWEHFGMLYASIPFSPFSLPPGIAEMEFQTGGKIAAI